MGRMADLDDVEKRMQEKKVNKFLDIIHASITNYFAKWCNSPLLLYSLFSEVGTGCSVAHVLCKSTYNGPTKFYSDEHALTIDMTSFHSFVIDNFPEENIDKVLEMEFVIKHMTEITMIKSGLDMWEDTHNNSPLGKCQDKFKGEFGGLGSNTQCTERGLKESGYVSLGKRG